MFPLDDTIAAIASPPGGAARGIVRISGPQSLDCVARFFQADREQPLSALPYPHAVAGQLRLPTLHSPLPCDVYFWTHGRSYTGQPLVEVHTIGSPPLLQLALRAFCDAGARPAEPGEFTLRAFLAGRIDLTQAEAVLGVIDAADPQELNVALGQLAGGLSHPLQHLRDSLIELLAHVEAGFDFADEDLPFITREELDRQLADAENRVAAILAQTISRSEPVDAVRAVLVGRTNVGKSSLFNALAGNHAAIVSEYPGTTRDYLVAELDIEGVRCRLVDVAGNRGEGRGERGEGEVLENAPRLRSRGGNSTIEQAAQSAAAAQRHQSQMQILCLDATRPLDDWEQNELARSAAGRIVVLTKCDGPRRADCRHAAIETSSRTGHGIETLRQELRRAALAAGGEHRDVVAGTAVRCCDSLRLAGQSLGHARRLAAEEREELAAEEIRVALNELGKVVGAVYTEDVLERIFSRFCVGK